MKQNANITGIGEQLSINNAIINPVEATVPHTTIVNSEGTPRKIPDLTKTLKPIVGKERVSIQQIYRIMDEFGPNGEQVFGTHGDQTGRIRLVGDWDQFIDTHGPRIEAITATNTFAEITFWGTGLNILTLVDSAGRDARVSVDGGSTGSNILPTSSGVLLAKRWSQNVIINAASNLSLGWHTVRIDVVAAGVNFYGIEILGTNNTIAIPAGEVMFGGKKYTNAISQTLSLISGFYGNPGLNGRGGRIAVYLDANGQLGKAIQQVDSVSKYLTNADHSNETEERLWHYADFGNGRNDDNSTIGYSANNRTYTMNDNVTRFSGNESRLIGANGDSGLNPANPGTAFAAFTFEGCGVDVTFQSEGNGGTNSFDVEIDGSAVGSITFTASRQEKRFKIASGLKYGHHIVRLLNTASPVYNTGIQNFITFKPKMPTIPAETVILGDTCLLADFDGSTATSTSNWYQSPTGTVSVSAIREFNYIGSWALDGPGPEFGWASFTFTNGDSFSYEFWGKGVTLLFSTRAASTSDFTLHIDGALNASGVDRSNMTNLGGGSYRIAQVGGTPARLEITGLTEGFHKITVTKTAGSEVLEFGGMWIHSSTYAHKTNTSHFHDCLDIGSCGFNTTVKLPNEVGVKNRSYCHGEAQNPTNSGNLFKTLNELSGSINVTKNFLRIKYYTKMTNNLGTGAGVYSVEARINGYRIPFSIQSQDTPNGSSTITHVSGDIRIPVNKGIHSVQIWWISASGTTTAFSNQRELELIEED